MWLDSSISQLLTEVLDPGCGLAAVLEVWLQLGYAVLGKPAKIMAVKRLISFFLLPFDCECLLLTWVV